MNGVGVHNALLK